MTFRGADNPARGWHEAADEALLCGFLRGEQAMAAELVRRYEQPLYRFLRRLSGNPSDVPDLFQETFLRALRGAGSFGGRSLFKSWLYAIAVNVCRAHARSERRKPMTSLPQAEVAVNGSPRPADAAERTELGERVAQAVATLPPGQHEVFILRAYEEMDYRQIAEVLGRPLGTVKSQMRLALGKMRAALQEIGRAYGAA